MSTDLIGAGETFTTVIAWAGGIPGTLSEVERGEIKNELITNSASSVDLSGVDIGAHSLTLTAASGASFVDVLNPATTAVRYYGGTQGATVYMTGSCNEIHFPGATVSKLMWRKDNAHGSALRSSGTAFVADQIIMYSSAGNTIFRGMGTFSRIIAYADADVKFAEMGDTATWTNWSFLKFGGGTALGLESQYSLAKSINGVVVGCGADGYAGTSASSSANNATDQGTFPGTGFNAGTPQTNVVAATEWTAAAAAATVDFRLASGSAKLKAAGTSSGAPATDIFGNSWNSGTPDIGAIRFAGAAPSVDYVLSPPQGPRLIRPRMVGY